MSGDPDGAAPLAGVSVVELTVHRAGPLCGSLLADLGADVVKIERPGTGDPARSQGVGPAGKSAYFTVNNRNKRSATLDLKREAGREAALELLAAADVFVENLGSGVADRLGVGYDDVRAVNPGIVYAAVKGYGGTGSLREKPGLDLILRAEGGIMSVTGPDGGEPVKMGRAIGDLTAGTFAALGVLARLYQRDAAGPGGGDSPDGRGDGPADFAGKFDVGLYDAIVTLLNEHLTEYTETGRVPGPQGTDHRTIVPYGPFETADGAVVTGVPADDRWDDFVDAVGCESVRGYRTNEARRAARDEVRAAIEARLRERATDEWLDRLTDAGFPVGPVNDVADVASHEQTAARNLLVDCEDDDWGEHALPGHPLHFPDYEPSIRRPAPRLGEHTEPAFREVAGDRTTLDDWRAGGAFGGGVKVAARAGTEAGKAGRTGSDRRGRRGQGMASAARSRSIASSS